MNVSSVKFFNHVKNNKFSFRGTPYVLPQHQIDDYHDALTQWSNLKYAKYSDVHSDKQQPTNKIFDWQIILF